MELLENRFLRNKDLIKQELLDEITVIGLGGIGSTVVTLLSIMGWDKIIGWDDDKLEEHNLSSTTYPFYYTGSSKADAAKDTAEAFSGKTTEFEPNKEKWNSSKPLGKKVITCLDNMDTRMEVYETWRNDGHDANDAFLIDLRMDALSIEMITITHRENGFDMYTKEPLEVEEIYNNYWVSDVEIEPAPCTMKHTIFSSSIIGGLGVNQAFNCVGNKPYYSYIWTGLLPLNLKKENLVKSIKNGVL